jgi:hypothetical protein
MGISIERCENKRIPNATRVTKTPTNMQATTVNDLNQLDNHLILKISDDGVGFNVKIPKRNWTTKHYLQNKWCSGVVTIESKKTKEQS